MNRVTVRFVWTLGLLLFESSVLGGVAAATPVATPYDMVDSSCVHEVPNGAEIDPIGGDIRLNGSVVAHHEPCAVPWSHQATGVNRSGQPPVVASGGFWYGETDAWAQTVSGLQQFNDLQVEWTVPAAPAVQDTSMQFMFPALQNVPPPPSTTPVSILQPVLSWGWNGYFGDHHWDIASWAVINGGNVWHTPLSSHANPGDLIRGHIFQTGASPDQWEIDTSEITQGWYAFLYWGSHGMPAIPASWPKYNFATLGAFEAYGRLATPSAPLNSCNELSPSNLVQYKLDYVGLAGPDWNSFNPAWSIISWVDVVNHANKPPACCWNATHGTFPGWTVVNESQVDWCEH